MDRTELLERASHYRELAARVTDEQARAGLLELAGLYEGLAERSRREPLMILQATEQPCCRDS